MSWTETKYAINSTLGTDDFKPLNKIIEGNWNLIASDNVYASEKAMYSGSSGVYTLSNSFKVRSSGTVRFAVNATFSANTEYTFNVKRNGQIVASYSRTGTGNEVLMPAEASVNRGDVFTFELRRSSGSGTVTNINNVEIRAYPIYAPILVESVKEV